MIKLNERLNRANNLVAGLRQNALDKENGINPTRNDVVGFKGTLKEAEAYQRFVSLMNMNNDFDTPSPSMKASLKEMLTSTDTIQMIPHVIEGAMIEAAEPEYLATNFFNTIQVPNTTGIIVQVPIVGEIFVHEVGEAQPYEEASLDYTMIEKSYIKVAVKKVGARVSITEEAMDSFTWDVYQVITSKFGRAFARFKEERCMNEFTKHGHLVFDNDPNVVAQDSRYRTTGRDKAGAYNNTLSMEDFLDMALACITNEHTPTDCIMHPLTWIVFAKNSMAGVGMTWGALGGQSIHPWGGTQGSGAIGGSTQNDMGNQQFIMAPEQVQNRLPMPLKINLSPFVNFDKERKLFDMYVLDRNNVGVIAQVSGIKMDNWKDPERDISFTKANEKYGVGISGDSRGIMVARNLAVATTYPEAIPVHMVVDGVTNP